MTSGTPFSNTVRLSTPQTHRIKVMKHEDREKIKLAKGRRKRDDSQRWTGKTMDILSFFQICSNSEGWVKHHLCGGVNAGEKKFAILETFASENVPKVGNTSLHLEIISVTMQCIFEWRWTENPEHFLGQLSFFFSFFQCQFQIPMFKFFRKLSQNFPGLQKAAFLVWLGSLNDVYYTTIAVAIMFIHSFLWCGLDVMFTSAWSSKQT